MKNTVFWDVTQCDSFKKDVSEEYIASSETSALTRGTQRNIPEDRIFGAY
jgi:hypothetical protein